MSLQDPKLQENAPSSLQEASPSPGSGLSWEYSPRSRIQEEKLSNSGSLTPVKTTGGPGDWERDRNERVSQDLKVVIYLDFLFLLLLLLHCCTYNYCIILLCMLLFLHLFLLFPSLPNLTCSKPEQPHRRHSSLPGLLGQQQEEQWLLVAAPPATTPAPTRLTQLERTHRRAMSDASTIDFRYFQVLTFSWFHSWPWVLLSQFLSPLFILLQAVVGMRMGKISLAAGPR